MGWCAVHTHFRYAQCELGNHTILVRNTYFCFNCVNSEGSMRKHNQIYVSNGALNPYSKLRTRKNVWLPMGKFWYLNFTCLNFPEIKTMSLYHKLQLLGKYSMQKAL